MQNSGKVILAGAGPGDIDLITVKLQKALMKADVIITDRLVNPLIIDTYKKEDAQVIEAGKQGYNCLSHSQEFINYAIVENALAGKIVLRLKGGDVAFFSNVLEELLSIHLRSIPFEIIPGITAASGASAYAGIPLTGRGYSRTVRFLLYKNENDYTSNEWLSLAETSDTLVLYMGIKKLPEFLNLLKKYGDVGNKEVAIVEQATTAYQKVHCFSIKDDPATWLLPNHQTPGLVIIGAVATLHKSFNWFKTETDQGSIFNEIEIKEQDVIRK